MKYLSLLEKIRTKLVNEIDKVKGHVFIQTVKTAPRTSPPLPCLILHASNPSTNEKMYHEVYRISLRIEILVDDFSNLEDISTDLDTMFINQHLSLGDNIYFVSNLITKSYDGYSSSYKAETYSVTYFCRVLET